MGEMNMEGFLLFFHKFCFNTCLVSVDSWMIIVLVMSWYLVCWGCEVTFEWDSFCADPNCMWIVWDWVVGSERMDVEYSARIIGNTDPEGRFRIFLADRQKKVGQISVHTDRKKGLGGQVSWKALK
jgi:hypothetical protein